jgi:hypothetical protein
MSQFRKLQETFNADYLKYIVDHLEEFKPLMRWRKRYDDFDPLVIAKKYLQRSIKGNVVVNYRQNDGKGRFCAVGSLSLQVIPREIRHTIAKEYYIDVDMSNAHPVILQWLCKKNRYLCPQLDNYILNREECLKKVDKDRDKAKQIYLALTNGGNKDFNNLKTPCIELERYKNEMIRLHQFFAGENYNDYEKVKEKRKKNNKDYNHEASYMNTLLCDTENMLLMEMWEYFGSPENCVLCFDGIMLRNNKEYDIEGCKKHIIDKYDMPLFDLRCKSMDEGFDMSNKKIKKYNDTSFQYFTDYRKLVNKEVYQEEVDEWVNNTLKLILNGGKMFFITKNKNIIRHDDGRVEHRDTWTPRKIKEIEETLKPNCNIINPFYDYDFYSRYMRMTNKEKSMLKLSKEELHKKIKKFAYTTLGITKTKTNEGYLSYIMDNLHIKSYDKTDFCPKLGILNDNDDDHTFNLFEPYPMEIIDEYKEVDFEKSLLYTHLKKDFFNNDEGELNHFLDHVADIIQDPARIKGTSHLFYSKQGCGKGLLVKFMCRLLGMSNVLTITDTEKYFEKNFNINNANKLLKVFEEVSEKGSAYKNHNRLKGEQTSSEERIEPKGIDAYTNKHCARYWYLTNNENSLYIENDDRRHTLHRISSEHQNNYEYFKPIWNEIENIDFLKSAFEFFRNRKYEDKNVRNAYTTNYKKEQKNINLPSGIKFILHFVKKRFKKIEDVTHRIKSSTLKQSYKRFCESKGSRYHLNTLNTQIKKIGIQKPIQLRVKGDRKFCYKLNTYTLEEEMKKFLQDNEYSLFSTEEIEEVDDVLGSDYDYDSD